MSALDRIRRVTLLDVRPGDVLLLECAPVGEVPPGAPHPYEEVADVVRGALAVAGHDPERIGVLVTGRGELYAKIIRADQ